MSVYYNDIDPYCCKVLEKNIRAGNLPGGWVDGRDIRDVRASDLMGYRHIHLFAGIGVFPLALHRTGVPADLTIITGGLPCQPHSLAGKRRASTDERDLWPEFARLIRTVRPDYVLVENVLGFLSSERGAFFGGVLRDLAEAGYDAEWLVLRASDFGAPHRRERVFLLAYSGGKGLPIRQGEEGEWAYTPTARGSTGEIETGMGRDPGRAASWLDGYRWPAGPGAEQYEWEPPRTVSEKQLHRVARLKALGNTIVLPCAEYMARLIIEREVRVDNLLSICYNEKRGGADAPPLQGKDQKDVSDW